MRIAGLVVLALSVSAAAQAPRWTLYEENDTHLISRIEGRDRHYTQGLKIEYISPESGIGFTIGQNIYTPQNISVSALQPDERPYAAWLYVGAIGLIERENVIHRFEIDAGTMGPRALGKKIQTKWHDLIHVDYPQGWKNQIKNEPGILLQYSQRRRHAKLSSEDSPWSADAVGRYAGVAGNVFSYAAIEPIVRVGYNVSDEFVPEAIPAIVNPPPAPPPPNLAPYGGRIPFEFYVFAGVEGRAVLISELLEGNCCVSPPSHGVRHKTFVGTTDWGWSARLWSTRVTWRQMRRSREFVGQKQSDVYGAVAITYDRAF